MTRATRLAVGLSILAVAVRFIGVSQPFIDNWSWRQSDVATIARNFSRGGFDFFHPRIDWAGAEPGYVGTEFPILPFAVSIAYKAIGEHDWLGRAETILFFAMSLPFFFLLVRDLFGELAAVWSLFFYSFAPLSLFASREFMPDMPSLSLAIAGVYLFRRWMATAGSTMLLASAVCASLSILIKLPSIVIAAPLAAVAGIGDPGRRPRCRLQLLLFAIVTLVPAGVWYWHAYRTAQQFYPHHYFGAGGIRIMSINWYWGIFQQLATSSLTPLLFVLGVVGVVLSVREANARIFVAWLAAMLLFIFTAGYGSRHQWYQLPLVPIFAAFAGNVCARVAAGKPLSILLVAAFAALAFLGVRPLYHSAAAYLRAAGVELQATPRSSLIAAADNGDPTLLYYAGRRGWHFPEQDGIYAGDPADAQQLIVDLGALRARGATHLALTVSTMWWLDAFPQFAQYLATNAKLMKRSADCAIYSLP